MLVVLSGFVAGCRSIPEPFSSEGLVMGASTNLSCNEAAQMNRATLSTSFKQERLVLDLVKPDADQALAITNLPTLGVSLSGGGNRSAWFSIGVLQGLHTSGVLTNVDYISSVSGGGYASAWFFAQQRVWLQSNKVERPELKEFQSKLLDDKELFLEHAERTSRLGSESASGYWTYLAGRYLFSLLWLPFHTSSHLIGDRDATWIGHSYRLGLEKTYLLHPISKKKDKYDFANRRRTFEDFGGPLHRSQPIPMVDLKETVLLMGRPIPIFNCTVAMGPRPGSKDANLTDRVFEISPWQTGAASLGYSSNTAKFPDLNSAMAFSGAAVDSEAPMIKGNLKKWWLRMTGKNLGGFITNIYSTKPEHLYLSDGGHSENLGVLPLIRRGCRTIIVVDAEHEKGPANIFKSYFDLKCALRKELNIEFALDGLETNSSGYCFSGSIGPIPILTDDGAIHLLTQKIIYLKLPLTQCYAKDTLPTNMWKQPAIQNYIKNKRRESKKFPQNPTSDQNYSPERARAYRALGQGYGELASTKFKEIQAASEANFTNHSDK